MKVTNIVARLRGKKIAYTGTQEVSELLRQQADRVQDRLPVHLERFAAVVRESGPLGYQPGLVTLREEAYDSALYAEAALTTARQAGHTDLADALEDLAETLHEATALLACAVHATVPVPQMPLDQAA